MRACPARRVEDLTVPHGRFRIPARVSVCLIVSACLALAACVRVEIRSPEGRDLVDRLPAGAVGAFGGSGEVPGYLREALPGAAALQAPPGELGELIREAGIDHGDLDSFAGAVLAPAVEGGIPSMQVVTVLRGDFDRERIERALADRPISEHEGTTIYELETPEAIWPAEIRQHLAGFLETTAAVLDEETLVVGGSDGTRAVLDVEAGAPSLRQNEGLEALIDEASLDDPTHWAVVSVDRLVDSLSGDPALSEQVTGRAFRSLVMSARLDEAGARGRIVLETRDEAAARLQRDALQGALAAMKLGLRASRPEVVEILDRGVETTQEGPTTRLEFELTAEDVVTLQQASTARARELLEETGGEAREGAR